MTSSKVPTYDLESSYVYHNYPELYAIFAVEPSQSPSKAPNTQNSTKGYDFFKETLEAIKTRYNNKL